MHYHFKTFLKKLTRGLNCGNDKIWITWVILIIEIILALLIFFFVFKTLEKFELQLESKNKIKSGIINIQNNKK
jgi:uncharacterized integral membrane protein